MRIAFRQAAGLLLIGVAVLFAYSLYSFSLCDQSFLMRSADARAYENGLGSIVPWFVSLLLALFSSASYYFVFMGIVSGICLYRGVSMRAGNSGVLFLFFGSLITSAAQRFSFVKGVTPGGWVGVSIYTKLVAMTDQTTAFGIGLLISFVGALLVGFWPVLYGVNYVHKVLESCGVVAYLRSTFSSANPLRWRSVERLKPTLFEQQAQEAIAEELKIWSMDAIFDDPYWGRSAQPQAPHMHATPSSEAEGQMSTRVRQSVVADKLPAYVMPRMLERSDESPSLAAYKDIEEQRAQQLSHKLQQFGIEGTVKSVTVGPVVTVFEYEPASNIKISRILSLRDDLSLALEAQSLRINAPIPGKSVIGFEVAHSHRFPVHLADVLDGALSKGLSLPVTLGVDTSGKPVTMDIAQLPHLLIAGSTGSGKSVVLHTILMNLLCARHPDELKLVIIDPKRLEFNRYADIAHLLTPIVADMKMAPRILQWLVEHMEERYAQLAEAGVRTIEQYHSVYGAASLPYIVVLIDEFADLMMQGGKETEYSLIRLAQMARAAGIHIVLATQRPSADVITGLIKVNVPSRIACKVMSQIDSRTVLDSQGAETLLGKGDMLWLSPEGTVKRLHGAYVSEDEIESVVSRIRKQREPEYITINTPSATESSDDDLYEDVRIFVQTCETVSISLIQRRFRIGYNRSARLVEMLEKDGVISPQSGGKSRTVL